MARFARLDLLGAWCCRERRTASGSGRARDRQLESESEGPPIGTCGGDRLGWRQAGSSLGTLGLRAPCPEPPDEVATPLLVEDEPQSDTSGWERLNGRFLVPFPVVARISPEIRTPRIRSEGSDQLFSITY